MGFFPWLSLFICKNEWPTDFDLWDFLGYFQTLCQLNRTFEVKSCTYVQILMVMDLLLFSICQINFFQLDKNEALTFGASWALELCIRAHNVQKGTAQHGMPCLAVRGVLAPGLNALNMFYCPISLLPHFKKQPWDMSSAICISLIFLKDTRYRVSEKLSVTWPKISFYWNLNFSVKSQHLWKQPTTGEFSREKDWNI